ncbi:hypothetical protein EV715DRAFT_269564 [Schizophyllum commune]
MGACLLDPELLFSTLPSSSRAQHVEDYPPIVIAALRAAIRFHYTFRGTKFKCRSPLDFTSDNDGMLVLRNIPVGPDDREAALRVAVDDLKAALERLVQTSPTLAVLLPTARKVAALMHLNKALIDEFCSETTVHLEAQTHHRHPYSPTTSNSAISLYTLIYAIARETHGERTLDLWVKSNLERAMYSVSYVLNLSAMILIQFSALSEDALASLEPATNLTVSTEPYVASIPATIEEAGPAAPTSTISTAEEAAASDTVVDVSAESASPLSEELPKKRKNEDQPETSSQASKKAKTTTGALKRATSMVCRIPIARKSMASDKGKEVAPPPGDGEPAAPKIKGSRTAAFIRKPFGPVPSLPQWKGVQWAPTFDSFPGPHACASARAY